MAAKASEFIIEKKTFRGVEYTFTELSIEEFDEITKKATREVAVTDADGNTRQVEEFDERLQQRLLMAACVSPKVAPAKLGVRLYGSLWSSLRVLLFSPEPEPAKNGEKPAVVADDEEGKEQGE